MGLIVQKFGGSSVKDRDRIFNVARIVMNTRNAGNDVVVVVSAQGDTTDDLIAKAAEITSDPSHREMDMLLAAGEEISISLLTMALQELGVSAISLTGWQAGFNTDRAYSKARIKRLDTERVESELARNRVVVVAGFQGLNRSDDITTLGRGGSDIAIRARLYMYMGKKTEAYTAAREIIDAVDKNGKKVLELAGAGDINSSNFALPSECILALSNYEIEDNIRDLFKSDNTSTKIYLTEKQFNNDLFAGQSTAVNNRVQVWDRTPDNQGNVKPLLKKYNQPSSTTNMDMEVLATQKQVIPLIRLSEMYLIAIESAPTQNEANALYIPYMKARNVDASPLQQEQLMTEIIREYRREFFGEGQMFYTYKRLGIKNMLWKTDREVGEQDYVVPLPSTELTAN